LEWISIYPTTTGTILPDEHFCYQQKETWWALFLWSDQLVPISFATDRKGSLQPKATAFSGFHLQISNAFSAFQKNHPNLHKSLQIIPLVQQTERPVRIVTPVVAGVNTVTLMHTVY